MEYIVQVIIVVIAIIVGGSVASLLLAWLFGQRRKG